MDLETQRKIVILEGDLNKIITLFDRWAVMNAADALQAAQFLRALAIVDEFRYWAEGITPPPKFDDPVPIPPGDGTQKDTDAL